MPAWGKPSYPITGRTECVADDRIAKAKALATGPPSLAALHGGLREGLLSSPWCDGRRLTRHLGDT
ncbi:MAG: hypothetical protein P8164_14740 [Gammaproteobacteria bacterium]